MKDFYSVLEFSKISGVEASTLRYWDEIGLFSPVKRDPENNYRYYSLVQITALNFVSTLSDLGIPLKTIAELRVKRDPKRIVRLLEKRERQLDMELRKLRISSSIIHARQELIRRGLEVDESKISVISRDEDRMSILWPRNEYNDEDTFVDPLTAFINQAKDYNINLCFPVGGYYDSIESFTKAPGRPNHFYSIDPTGTNIRKKGDYLIGFTRGNYAEYGDLSQRMAAYIKENNLNISGPVYVVYLFDESCMLEPEQYLAQAMISVTRMKPRHKA